MKDLGQDADNQSNVQIRLEQLGAEIGDDRCYLDEVYVRGRGRGRGGGIARARIDWDRIMAMRMPQDNTKKYGWIGVSCLSGNSTPPASNIVPINKNEFVLATEFSMFPPFGGIYKYSTLDNRWTLIWEYPEGIKFMRNGFHALSFNEDTNELYLYGTQAEPHTKNSMICKINLYDFRHECIYVPRNHGAAVEPNTVIMNGKYHAVGGQGFHRSTHSIYDIETGTKQNLCIFSIEFLGI